MKNKKIKFDTLNDTEKNDLRDIFKSFNKKGEIYSFFGIYGNAKDILYVNELCAFIGFDCNFYKEKKKKFCLQCGNELKNGQYKFCSSSCSAKYNNHARGTLSKVTKDKISKSLLKYNSKNKTLKENNKPKSKKEIYCLECGKELNKNQYKFCSLDCCHLYNNKHKPKKYCRECGKELVRGQYKFCSLDCCSKHNIKYKVKKICPECGKEFISSKAKCCSILCSREHLKKENLKKCLNNEYYINPNGSLPFFLREYLLKRSDYKCELCGYSGFNKKTQNTILQIHHIDGNSGNNIIENLQVLCPNCHAETEDFMALNKGKSGRTKRYNKK